MRRRDSLFFFFRRFRRSGGLFVRTGFLRRGAVNAANLDGGTSTCLYLNGESIYSGFRLDCSRSIPTAFLIAPVK